MEEMIKKLPTLSFNSLRRFGIELEVNAFDKKNRPDEGRKVAGIDVVAREVGKFCDQGVDIRPYEHTVGNEKWVVKPDSSCGMEVVTPPLKGWRGLLQVCRVVDAFTRNPEIQVDHRCSVHVHVEVADLTDEQVGSILAHWIKCEPVFMDAMPPERKRNRYCPFIGLSSKFKHDWVPTGKMLIEELGDVKYYSLNTNQMLKAMRAGGPRRPTIEFRIVEADGCKDAFLIKNWVRLLIHFVETTARLPMPQEYKLGKDPMVNGLTWLDPEDVLNLLGFNIPQRYELSNAMTQTRNWFLARLQKYMSPHENGLPRSVAYGQLKTILARFREFGTTIRPEEHLSPSDLGKVLYGEEFKH